MQDPIVWLTISAVALIATTIVVWAALSGWRGWLELQRLRLDARREQPSAPPSSPAARIELADLKERVRKLEAIAAGVDL